MTEIVQFWAEAIRILEGSHPLALATVINVRGSTPREVGAKMLVHAAGQFGTIGGGCGEAEVFRKARLMLVEGVSTRLAEVDLTGDLDQNEIGSCGGLMDVFIHRWTPEADLPIARLLAEAVQLNLPRALLTVIDKGESSHLMTGAKILIDPARECGDNPIEGLSRASLDQIRQLAQRGLPFLLELGSDGGIAPAVRLEASPRTRVFLDPVSGMQHLVIAGAGHIAQPLAKLGSMLGFRVTVIDDRSSFANRERFPSADQIIVKPFGAAIDSLHLDRHCYVVSVTRGHAFDDETVRAALRQPGCFIGMIGSRRRVKATLARLQEEGFDPQLLDEIHAPLGLDIGAQTPEEIAISIMAEIVRELRTGRRDDFTLGVRSGRLRASV